LEEILPVIFIYLLIFGGVFILLFILLSLRRFNKKGSSKIDKITTQNKALALDDLRQIIRNNPKDMKAREKLADLLVESKSYLLAIKEYLTIIDHCATTPELNEITYLAKVGNTFNKLGNMDEARKYYLIVKKKDDLNFHANLNLGIMELSNQQYDKALHLLETANRVNPNSLSVMKPLAITQMHLKKFTLAKDVLLRILEQEPQDIDSTWYLANCYFNLKRNDEAMKYFTILIDSEKYQTESCYKLGHINKRKNLYNQAIEYFRQSLDKGKLPVDKLAEVHFHIGECYHNTHNLQKAVEHWQEVSHIMPGYPGIKEKLDTYTQLSSDSLFEKYITGSVTQFTSIVKHFVKYYIHTSSSLKGKVSFLNIQTTQDGSMEVFTEVTSGNFIEQYFFVFMRSVTTIGEFPLRNIYNRIKENKADKGICITAGNFSETAHDFVESRMLELVEKEKLITILREISKKLKKK
jgi:tetratricopeptide (TPR) repeat protein